ncbi:MAG: alpha/beta hydrolase-fold protein [Promethearchaeota archaeon]
MDGNPLNSPADRDISIYLPPEYYNLKEKRYPVIYFLHGYSGNNRGWTLTYRDSKDRAIPWELIPQKIVKKF